MLFYSFLALTVFLGYSCSKKAISKKDLYQEFNASKHWSKNVTRPWRRSITLKMKMFFERWNENTVLNTCRRFLSQGDVDTLFSQIQLDNAKLLPKYKWYWKQKKQTNLKKDDLFAKAFKETAFSLMIFPFIQESKETELVLTYY